MRLPVWRAAIGHGNGRRSIAAALHAIGGLYDLYGHLCARYGAVATLAISAGKILRDGL